MKQEPLSKPAPVQEDLPLDPDDLFSSDEETGTFNPETSTFVGVPPPPTCSFPGNTQELSDLPMTLREESTRSCLEHTSTPLVFNTNKATSPSVHDTGKVQPRECDNGPSCSQDIDSQFDKLMEEFASPDDFCNSFTQFDNEDALLGSSEGEGERVVIDSESDSSEEVEEVDHVKTVSEVAAEANLSNLFDPRVLGKCVEKYVERNCTSVVDYITLWSISMVKWYYSLFQSTIRNHSLWPHFQVPWLYNVSICNHGEPGIFSYVSEILSIEMGWKDLNCMWGYLEAQNSKKEHS